MMNNIFTKNNIVTFLLVLMSVQYVYIEGWEVSYIKFGVMCLTPLLWLIYSQKISTATIWGGLYFLSVLFSALFNIESFRFSTIGYLLSFIAMFITYYHLVYYENALNASQFEKILKGLIVAYAICLVLQQIARLAGIDYLPLINLNRGDPRGVLTAQSLAIEQSHSVRIVGALFLCLLRMYSLKFGDVLSALKALFAESKWLVIGFFWTMITMGSATAIVALAVISLIFIRPRYVFISIPVIIGVCAILASVDYPPVTRVINILAATMTLDADVVLHTDSSAGARIIPFIYTIENIDITSADTWFGLGTDTGVKGEFFGAYRMIGGIFDYGLLAYIFSLIFIFRCVIRRFFSIETIFFVVLMMAEIRSIAVWWCIFMMFTTVRYFFQKAENEEGKKNETTPLNVE